MCGGRREGIGETGSPRQLHQVSHTSSPLTPTVKICCLLIRLFKSKPNPQEIIMSKILHSTFVHHCQSTCNKQGLLYRMCSSGYWHVFSCLGVCLFQGQKGRNARRPGTDGVLLHTTYQLTSSLVLSSFPQLDSYEHYTTVALDGASGDVRWQHTPSDFQLNPAYRPVRLPQTEAKHCSISIAKYFGRICPILGSNSECSGQTVVALQQKMASNFFSWCSLCA